ncbi:MAG: putative Ig domain-containing protein [Pirellulales bacterium]
MTVTYEMGENTFSGVDRYDMPTGPDYVAQFRGSLNNETIDIVYTSPTQGTGNGGGNGAYSGTENYRPRASDRGSFSCVFDGTVEVIDNNGNLSRSGATGNSSCISRSFYDLSATGTIDVSSSPFAVAVRWSEGYDGGRGRITGKFSGDVTSISPFDYDIVLREVRWTDNQELPEVELSFEMSGPAQPTPNRTTAITEVKLFWSTSANPRDRIGAPLADKVPIYWNQSGGIARISGLPEPPAEATHLVVYADADQRIDEPEDVLGNACGLSLNTLRSVKWNTDRDNHSEGPTPRGFDVEYYVSDEDPLPIGTEMIYYWASGPTINDTIGEITREQLKPEDLASGKQVHNQPAHFPVPPREATHIVVELRRPNADQQELSEFECDFAPSVKALRIHLPEEILSAAAIEPELTSDGRGIRAPFNPGASLDLTTSEAEVVFGVDHFNWYQEVTYPDYIELLDRRDDLGDFLGRPYIDPYTETGDASILAAYSAYANGTPHDPLDVTKYERFGALPTDIYDYYYNEVPLNTETLPEIVSFTTSVGVPYFDKPEIPADFYRPDSSDATKFLTELVGVDRNHGLVRLTQVSEELRSFRWSSNATYPDTPGGTSSGGVILYVPPDWTGGQATAGGVSDLGPPPIPDQRIVPGDVSFRLPADASSMLDVLSASTIPLGAAYEIRAVTSPTHGAAAVNDLNTPLDPTDDQIVYVPEAGFSGIDSFTFTIRRTDAFDFASVRVTLYVGDAMVDAGGPYETVEGGSVRLSAFGVPIDGVTPIFVWDFDGDGIFGETEFDSEFGNENGPNPTFFANGIDGFPGSVKTVRVRLVDELDVTAAEASVDISIANLAPSVFDFGGNFVTTGQSVEIFASAFDPGDPTSELTFAWDLDGDGIFGESGGAAGRGDETGNPVIFNAVNLDGLMSTTYTARVRVTDDDGAVAETGIDVVIDGLFTPPTDLLLSSSSLRERLPGAIVGDLAVVDQDVNDSFVFEMSDPRFFVDELGQLRLQAGQFVSYLFESFISVDITVIDAGLHSFTKTFEIQVIDINDPPTRVTGRVGEFVLYDDLGPTVIDFDQLEYHPTDDTDPLQALSYRVVELPPAAVGRLLLSDGQTPIADETLYDLAQIESLIFEPATVNAEAIGAFRFEVIDNGGSANGGTDRITETLAITVLPSSVSGNTPPVLSPIGEEFGNERELVSIQLDATDGENDALTFDVDSLPTGAALDPDTGLFTWTPGVSQRGVYTLTFGVSDGIELDTETVILTIGSPWHNPRIDLDVTRDGAVGPVDALVVVNELNFLTIVDPVTKRFPDPLPEGYVVQYRYDVDDNSILTPRDALLVINFLNGIAESEADGEDLVGVPLGLDGLSSAGTASSSEVGVDSVSEEVQYHGLDTRDAGDWPWQEVVEDETIDLLARLRQRPAVRRTSSPSI